MRREVPLLITFFLGTFFVIDNFIDSKVWALWKGAAEELKSWCLIIIAFTFVLGVGNVIRIHWKKVRKRSPGWGYSVTTLAGCFVMILFGMFFMKFPSLGGGYQDGTVYDYIYTSLYVPMQATMFSLLAFFISSAAFRAFRARSFQASLLAVTAIIVIMGRVPFGELIWEKFPDLTEFIMSCLQMAGKRAILIGAALGAIATGLKLILGIERTYISGD